MPHRDREDMRPVSCEPAGVCGHAVYCPAAGAQAGDELGAQAVGLKLVARIIRDFIHMPVPTSTSLRSKGSSGAPYARDLAVTEQQNAARLYRRVRKTGRNRAHGHR